MKNFIKQVAILGGFYFIASFALSFFSGSIVDYIDWTVFYIFVLSIFVLMFKKRFRFLIVIAKKYPEATNYLYALGGVEAFGFLFGGVPGAIDGYLSVVSGNGEEYVSMFTVYMENFITMYWIVFWFALMGATYFSVIKPKRVKLPVQKEAKPQENKVEARAEKPKSPAKKKKKSQTKKK